MPENAVKSLADLFPESERVFYERAPLTQVVCQLKFPKILRIESQPPADFQDDIRGMFPLLEQVQMQVPAELPPEIAQMIGLSMAAGNFLFRSEDRKTAVHLTAETLSLSTSSYSTWESFKALLWPVMAALEQRYRPSFYQRVGLRYVDIIKRSDVNMAGTPWSHLLKQEVLGALASDQFEFSAEESTHRMRLRAADGGQLNFRYGLVKVRETQETAYRLDFDFFREEKVEVANAKPTINGLNAMVGRAFRWCIEPVLHDALGPKPIPLG
ncbi:TIGR04255 family protein [Bradyrhizobium sp. Bra78]|uniref:TIGR04255 family protein n=1 Tax=Bradyrhizobium sp. Bra78 TaxID=2926010 RepID=UPI0021C9865B|nr:TIGR04255 family protein [Bradyrhizobium sp. Bra78]